MNSPAFGDTAMFLLFMNQKNDDLAPLLRSWNETPVPTGRLAGPVWQRIERENEQRNWLSRLVGAIYYLDATIGRPRTIAAVVAVSLLVGIGFAELRTRYDAYAIDSEMSARYLSMLDTNNR